MKVRAAIFLLLPALLTLASASPTGSKVVRKVSSAPSASELDPVDSLSKVAQVGSSGSFSVSRIPSAGLGGAIALLRKAIPETATCIYGDTNNLEAGLALLSSLQNDGALPKDGVAALLQSLANSKRIWGLNTRTLLSGEDDGGCEKYFFHVYLKDGRLVQINYVPQDPDGG